MTGFKAYVQRGITLEANQSAAVDVSMQLGDVTQQVEVAAAVAQVDTQTANQSVDMPTKTVEELPSNMRNPFVLVQTRLRAIRV
jgi:hypothetical protein